MQIRPVFADFTLGASYSLHKEMWPASPGFGTYIGGIAAKGRWPTTQAVIVLAEVGTGRYENHWENGDLIYSGEDNFRAYKKEAPHRDQSLDAGGNRVLANQREKGYPLYLFHRGPGWETYTYAGLGTVESSVLVRRDGRMVAQFRIRPLGVASEPEARAIEAEVAHPFEAASLPPPSLIEPTGRRDTTSALRDRAFSTRIRLEYGDRCAVCGMGRRDAVGRPEVEAAHIHPKQYGGPDDPRNGIALCRLHHWAFDGHLFVLDDELRVKACHGGEAVEGVREYDGRPLTVLPRKPFLRPHPLFLEARRAMATVRAQPPTRATPRGRQGGQASI